MPGTRMEDERYSAFILVAVLIGVAAYVLAYGLQTLLYFEARHWASDVPALSVTPQTLTIPPAAVTAAPAGKAAKGAKNVSSAKTSPRGLIGLRLIQSNRSTHPSPHYQIATNRGASALFWLINATKRSARGSRRKSLMVGIQS